MSVKLNVYLHFRDNAREAMTFYQSVFGGELTISTFGEFGMADQDTSIKDLVMHSMLTAPAVEFMGADTPGFMEYAPIAGASMALFGTMADEAEMKQIWEKLGAGGQVVQPLESAPWGDTYGQITDKFGVDWMFNYGEPPQQS